MAEGVIIQIGVDDKGSPVITDVTAKMKDLEDQTNKNSEAGEKSGKSSEKAGKGMGKMAGAAKVAAAGVAAAAAAAVAAAAALAGVVAVAVKGVDAYREQEEVNRALAQSFAVAGAAGEQHAMAMEQTAAAIGNLAKQTNFGDEELSRMAASFVRITGDAAMTSEQLSLVADIAHGMGVEGEKAAKIFARAMKGDIPAELAKATALTKEQIAAINAMEDPTKRAAAAQAALSDQFKGMASDIDPTYRAIKNLEDAKGDLLQKIGEVIVESGAFAPVIEGVANAFNGLEGWIESNKETIQNWIFDGVQIALEYALGLMDTLIRMGPVFGAVIPYVQQVGQNFNILVASIKTVANVALAFRSAVSAGVLNTLDAVLAGVEQVASYFGKELPAGFGKARKALQEAARDLEDNVVAKMEAAGEESAKVGEALRQSVENWSRMDEHGAKFVGMVSAARSGIEGIADNVAAAREELGKSTAPEVGRGAVGGGGSADTAEFDAAAAQARKEAALAEEVARIRLQALNEVDEAEKARLETQAAILELNAKELPQQQHALELTRIQIAERERLARVQHDAVMAEIEAAEIQEEIAQRRREAIQAETQAIMDRNAATLAGLDQSLPGIEALGAGLMNIRDLQWGTKEATDATMAAMSGLAQVGSGIANLITKDKKQAAKIEAAFSAAAAIGSFAAYAATGFTAQPLLVASINHGIAAAQYGAIAGGGGGSGGPRRGASGGGAGAGSAQRSAEAVEGESIGQRRHAVNITYDFSGSTNLESAPAIERRLSDATRRSEQSRFIAGDVR